MRGTMLFDNRPEEWRNLEKLRSRSRRRHHCRQSHENGNFQDEDRYKKPDVWSRVPANLRRDSQAIVILMRDTGMRNERELFRMRIENLDWQNHVIFVPHSKTAEG